MKTIPLFDSVVHPTLTGGWLKPAHKGLTIKRLLAEMKEAGVGRALCVGMKGIGGYEERAYAAALAPFAGTLIPAAYFDFDRIRTKKDVARRLKEIAGLGYKAIKIHPRISKITLDHPLLKDVIKEGVRAGLLPMLCTYFQDRGNKNSANNLISLRRLLEEVAGSKLMLVHGGTVNVLEMMEIARPYPEFLLDLSMTLCKYEGTSLDQDLAYLFRNFDRRICVGSDFPEYPLAQLRARFEKFAAGVAPDKLANIAHKNIETFLGLENIHGT